MICKNGMMRIAISIHALRMERDACSEEEWVMTGIFQSTRSAWSATYDLQKWDDAYCHFNPRAPHGARPIAAISRRSEATAFQSTRSAWSATALMMHGCNYYSISIHALRMERDIMPAVVMISARNFNPRAPHGARLFVPTSSASRFDFNPRAPHGARLPDFLIDIKCLDFNPRAPHGARLYAGAERRQTNHFNPRAPHGARPGLPSGQSFRSAFQSTRSAWSATSGSSTTQPRARNFNPRAPHGARPADPPPPPP